MFRHWLLHAINARTNHVHVVVSIGATKPERALNAFKANATRQMRADGNWRKAHSPWADKGSQRYLWNERSVVLAVDYVVNGQGGDLPDFDWVVSQGTIRNPPATAGGTDLTQRPTRYRRWYWLARSAILPLLALLGNRPDRMHRDRNIKQWMGERRFLKPSIQTALKEPRTRFQSASIKRLTLRSLAVAAEFEHDWAVRRSSRLNQFGSHLQCQVVQNHYANDLDLFELDRRQTRLHLFSQVVIANQLPAYSAGNLQPQRNSWSAPAERSGDGALDRFRIREQQQSQSAVAAALCRRTPQFQKENQCQES